MIRLLLLLLFFLYSCSTTSTEYRSAKTYVAQRDYERAEQIALQGIQNNPNDALTAYYLAAIIYGGQNSPKKDYAKTGEYFNLALEIDNQNDEEQLLPDPVPVFNKNNEKVELITVKDAVYHDRYIVWGELYNQSVGFIDKQQNKKAVAPLELAALVDPQNPITYSVLCKLFFELGNEYFAKSIQSADKALSIDNSLTDLLTIKAEIAKLNNDFMKAEEYLKQAYETAIINKEDPKTLTFHMANLFDILFTNGKKNEALDLSEKLIDSDPENVLLYSNAGALYQNILIDEQNKASKLLSRINSLNEQQLEDLKIIYQNCLELAQKARENFLMCNQLELDEETSELFYKEAKKLKIIKNDLKSYIRQIDKKIDEL